MINIAKRTESYIHKISQNLRWISMGTLFLMMFLVTAGVIARYIFNKPIKGDMEIQELMMVLIVFVALPFLQHEKGNVYVELLVERLKGRPKAILQTVSQLLGMLILILIIWQTGIKAVHGLASMNTDVTLSLLIPTAPFVLIADIGLVFFGIEWLIGLIHSFHQAIKPQTAKQ
jgi:TRAP-type transport system small permease protein